VASPPGGGPPYVPIRATRWPVRRTPVWLVLAGVAVIAVTVVLSLVHRPSQGERASDLRGFLQTVNSDIESCAGGVGESLTALREIGSGASHDVTDGITVAANGASNCSPANNELIDDLEAYQVPESLASFHLQDAVTGLVNWAAPDAETVQTDVARLLAARSPATRTLVRAALARAVARLNAQRTAADAVMDNAIRSLAVTAAPPRLPG
jgi:hypothetical protein